MDFDQEIEVTLMGALFEMGAIPYLQGQALLSVGADIWFSPRAESGDELRPFDHNHKVVSANAHLCPPGKSS